MHFVIEHFNSAAHLLALFGDELVVQFKAGLKGDRVVGDRRSKSRAKNLCVNNHF